MKHSTPTLSAIAISLLLLGCGGSDDPGPAPTSHKLTAIDGYLINAEVYIDRNNNGVADPDEKLAKRTNENGEIAIATADLNYNVIIRAIAGETRDSDKGGTVDSNFDLIAPANNPVATPFTTLAHIQDITMEELAAELGYSEKTLSGDYIALKQSEPDAAKAHLFARSLSPSLSDTTELEQRSRAIQQSIDALGNNSEDFDRHIIRISDSGGAFTTLMQPTLQEFMDEKSYFTFSLNDFWRTRNNGDETANWDFDINNASVSIDGTELTLSFDSNNPNSFFMTWEGQECEHPYQPGFCRSEMQDDLIFMEHPFALAVSVDGDIQVYIQPSMTETIDHNLAGFDAYDLSQSPIEQNGYYHLDDESTTWSPTPRLTVLGNDSIAIVGDETQGVIEFDGDTYQVLRGNGELYLIKRQDDDHPSLLIRSEDLALSLRDKWQNHSLVDPSTR
ncbi:hypothetical protein [Thaumasiovibrio sp. DFM-14]|uniref:hypothetical protein n=1 Tax=Thaumasiovibrio sp. DFM-14 TaxID=3384792 RepID=UPI0039A108AD